MAEECDWSEKAKDLEQLATTLMMKHKYPEALRLFRLAAAIWEEESELKWPSAYNNIAIAYHFLGQDELAVLYFEKSIDRFLQVGWFDRIFDQKISLAVCWCTLGELHATAAALDEAKREVHLVEFPVVSVDRPGYTELTNALRVLQTALKDHADSRQQKADSYALMRYIYRLTGKLEDALQMHELCVNHGGSEFDTIGHGLMMAEQDEEGAYSYLQNLSEQQNIDHFRKRDTYNSMGLLLARQGRNQEAKEHHIKSLKLALEFRCPNAAMLTYFYLGQVEHRAALDSQKTPFVRKYYEKGLALAEKLKVRAAAVSLRNCSPQAALSDGQLQRMKDLFQYRQELAQQDPYKMAEALVWLNSSYFPIFPDFQFVLESAHRALDLLGRLPKDSRVKRLLAKCHSHRSGAYFRLGDFENATNSIKVAISLFEELPGNIGDVIELLIFKARVSYASGDRTQLPECKNDLNKALKLLAEPTLDFMFSWEKDRKAAAYYLLLCIASKEHRFEGSQEAREEAMIHFSQCKQYAEGNAETLIMAHIEMAEIHYSIWTQFQTSLKRASKDSKVEGNSVKDSVSYLLAAEDAHKAHLELARRRGSPMTLATSLSAMGEFYKLRKNYAEALLLLEEAVLLHADLLSSVEHTAGSSLEFMRITQSTFSSLLSCIASQNDLAVREEGLVWAERLRTRTLMRAMDLNFKEDPLIGVDKFDKDKQGALKTIKDFSISCPDVVFVEYALTNSEILIWVIKSGLIVLRKLSFNKFLGFSVAYVNQIRDIWDLSPTEQKRKRDFWRETNLMIGLSRGGVRPLIQKTVEYIKSSFKMDEYLRILGMLLLDPIREDLASVSEDQCIVFIPHEELASVPFAALQGVDKEYLVKHHTIAVSMSMRAYACCESRYSHIKVRTDVPNVLLVSNPFPLDSADSMGLSSPYQRLEQLREAESEARTIGKCMQAKVKPLRVRHLSGHRAPKVAVMEELPKADWVHFACHGSVSDKYPQGVLLLGQTIGSWWLTCFVTVISFLCWLFGARLPSFVYEKAGAFHTTGMLGAEEVLKCGMRARCAVVHACNSAQGKFTADGLFNWSHILQQVGVPSAVLCHWEVEDSAGRKFMGILYDHLTNMVPLGLALRRTMVALINNGETCENWASYSLVGVPHVQFPRRVLEQLQSMNIARRRETLEQPNGYEEENGEGVPPRTSMKAPVLDATPEQSDEDESSDGTPPNSSIAHISDATPEQSDEMDPFAVLGLPRDCSQADIDQAFRKIILELLPKISGDYVQLGD